MAAACNSITDGSKKILLVWSRPTTENISFPVTKLFTRLLLLNQYVCRTIITTDTFLLIIPRADLEELLNDPVYKFPQVEVIYVYYDNNISFERDQADLQNIHTKLRFCHERDLIKELDKPKIDNAVHPSRPIDRTAINSFASSVTQRVSAKKPSSTSRQSTAQKAFSSTSLHGFSVKNIDQIAPRFICPSCNLIIREPYQLVCGHRTCQSCINVENDKTSCLACSEVSSSKSIWLDKGFRREMGKILISCAEHIEQNHQEHDNQQDQSNIPASLFSAHMFNNNAQRQNPLSPIQNSITILSNKVNELHNDRQRIHGELCSSQNLLQTTCKELSSLKSSLEDNLHIANAITIVNELSHQEIWSLKQKLEYGFFTSCDGTFLWKITDVEDKFVDAQSERRKSIYSPPFYSSSTGYKMCMRLYLNGDDDVRGTHLSLFLVIMRGDFDGILRWPFEYKVTFYLMDQSTLDINQRNISEYFWPDTTLACFQRPVCNMNDSYGIKKFLPLELLEKHRNLYIQDGVMFIRMEGDFSTERPGTSGTGATANDDDHIGPIGGNILHIS